MCGILGIVCRPGRFEAARVRSALDTIRHRGPDDSGLETHRVGAWEVWLGHRRLSIVDLSEAGHQPLWVEEAGRRGAIVFNGEIYNHAELRVQGRGPWRSNTDTEVLLRGLMTVGPSYLERTNGMFAFAALDVDRREVLLARDRMGKKPLYVYETPELVAFASELKALVALGLELRPDAEALALYRWMGYVPAHLTAYEQVRKFDAASWARLDLDGERLTVGASTLYWHPLGGYASHWSGTYDDAIDAFLEVFDDATALRLMADVPVGAFLSGGIDSSLVVASIARSGADVSAYTVKPADPRIDESDVAANTARLLGIDCEVLVLADTSYQQQFPRVVRHFDEPFADFSAIPTLAVSEAARRHVKVVLTGDGGDELFLGYPWFGYPELLWKWRRFLPVAGLRRGLASALGTDIGTEIVRVAAGRAGLQTDNADVKALILAELLQAREPSRLYDRFKCMIQRERLSEPDRAILADRSLVELARDWYPRYGWDVVAERSLTELLAAVDQVMFMRDDVLVKVDRATMAFGLEARSPFLDHRVVELAHSLPVDFKVRDGRFKALLRDALERRLPHGPAARPKLGFGAPFPSEDELTLPPGPSPTARWSRWVEHEWKAAAKVHGGRPMRVMFLINNLAAGGAERVVSLLSQALAKEHVIDVVLLEDEISYEVGGHVTVLQTPVVAGSPADRLTNLDGAVEAFSELRAEGRPDVVVSFMFWANLVNLLSSGPGARVASVRTMLSEELFAPRLSAMAIRQIVRRAYPRADLVVTLSRGVADDLEANFAIPRAKLFPIYNPIDVELVQRGARAALPEGAAEFYDGDVVVAVGRHVREKGFLALVRVFAEYRRTGGRARLAFVGAGPLEGETIALAAELGLRVGTGFDVADAEVLFAGYQPNPFPWVRAATIFVMSSVQEGFGNVILEAMACEAPVLAADCRSGPREILAPRTPRTAQASEVEFAEFGVLLPPFAPDRLDDAITIGRWSQALHDVLDDEGVRRRYREAGLRRIEDFRVEKIAALWESTLASLTR